MKVCTEDTKPTDFGEITFSVQNAAAVEVTVTLENDEERTYRVSRSFCQSLVSFRGPCL